MLVSSSALNFEFCGILFEMKEVERSGDVGVFPGQGSTLQLGATSSVTVISTILHLLASVCVSPTWPKRLERSPTDRQTSRNAWTEPPIHRAYHGSGAQVSATCVRHSSPPSFRPLCVCQLVFTLLPEDFEERSRKRWWPREIGMSLGFRPRLRTQPGQLATQSATKLLHRGTCLLITRPCSSAHF